MDNKVKRLSQQFAQISNEIDELVAIIDEVPSDDVRTQFVLALLAACDCDVEAVREALYGMVNNIKRVYERRGD